MGRWLPRFKDVGDSRQAGPRSGLTRGVLGLGALAVASLVAGVAVAATPALIPIPAEIHPGQGGFRVADGAVLSVPRNDAQARFAAREAADLTQRTRGLKLRVVEGGTGGALRLTLDPNAPVGAEGYVLTVTPRGVRVWARDEAGLFYGAMTLAQLLSPSDTFAAQRGAPVTLAAMTIRDQPRFVWRGLLLDVARHYQPVDSIEALLDAMAAQKLNVFHWHLTDDQGWRLEIKRYPRLTEIGAWRKPPSVGAGDGHLPRYGGFYTQDQVREIVAYAAARHITVVPEIDMPGHAQALVAAYPEIGVTGTRPDVAVDWGVNPYLLNVDEKSLTFIHNVLDEVMALFPSSFVHVGGDEALKDQWKASPQIQAQMKMLGIKSEDALQSWFVSDLGRYLAAHGRRLIGWDEILDGGLPPTASIMSWRGAEGAVIAAKAGHDVVLSPTTLYFDNLQSARTDEPQGRIGNSPLAFAYSVDVTPRGLDAAELRHVLGVQGNVWTEYLTSPQLVVHAAFPRIAALAEAAWSPADKHDFRDFLQRLPAELERWRRVGIEPADSAFAPDFQIAGGPDAALDQGRATVSLSDQTKFGEIRYTLDGGAPSMASPLYDKPLTLKLGTEIKAATFTAQGQRLAATRALSLAPQALLTRASHDLQACPNGAMGLRVPLNPDSTTPGPVFDVNLFDACWTYPKARLDGVARIEVAAARLPRNYGLAHDIDKVLSHPAATKFGELSIRAGGCDGALIATIPLPDPAVEPNTRLPLSATLPPMTGEKDLCLLFTAPTDGPLYAIDRVKLVEGGGK